MVVRRFSEAGVTVLVTILGRPHKLVSSFRVQGSSKLLVFRKARGL